MINSAPILSVVHQLSLDLSNSKDSNEIYTTYCRAVLDLLPADRFAVALLDPDAQLRIVFSRNSQKDFEVGQAEMELCKRVVASGNSVHVSVDDLGGWGSLCVLRPLLLVLLRLEVTARTILFAKHT
jgi:GAF domain-containing protein